MKTQAASPVLAYSRTLQLPVDVIVQPQARPTDVPLAWTQHPNPAASIAQTGAPFEDAARLWR